MAVAGMWCKQEGDKNGNVTQGGCMSATTQPSFAVCAYVCVCVCVRVGIQYLRSLCCWMFEAGLQGDPFRARLSRQGVLAHKPCGPTELMIVMKDTRM